MFGAWHEWLFGFGALLCSGAAVKIMDDFLDSDFDRFRGRRTLAVKLGRAALPYGLVLAMLGAYFDLPLALAVFFGSYAVGMFSTWKLRLPTRLPSYVEIVLAVLLAVLTAGPALALWGLAMMAVVDWLDDLVDISADKAAGQDNIAMKIGIVETLFLVMMALCAAVLLNARDTALTFIAVAVLSMVADLTTTRLWSTHDQGTGSVDSR
ncbi:hypothetical protein LLE49_19775 [Alicyclobacillus tolerans]|uniref:hypothetical protein n=1 Tax=Alicyclobacillus tolerans TaxID=90970 RepID=UPI001F25DE18|nr:hypothetical protein [Alicyclobacillus tolerans]MCF8566963.1 hypothetical protein [Alicyclobacillus tolerans]